MRFRITALLGLVLCLLAATACGGGGSVSLGQMPADEQLPLPVDEETPAEFAALPNIAELEGSSHEVSLAGPEWKELLPYPELGGLLAQAEVSILGPGQMRMIGGPIMSYAMYGVSGFEADSFPTSLRIGTESELGEYYIAVANFKKGRWVHLGPFTNDVTAELPFYEEFSSREAYVSPANNFYFALVVPSGSGFDIMSLELGLRPSQSGPRPPLFYVLPEGESKLVISWLHSPDVHAADFAGYRVERAPLLLGDFESLTPLPVRTDYFVDETVDADTAYRYRVAAEDLGGLRSQWVPLEAHTQTGLLTRPVCVVNGPQGILHGPAFAGFDLSQSYDPEGQEITEYSVNTIPFGEQILPGSHYSTLLAPGCHLLRFEVTTADMRSGATFATVKVMPQWESQPQLVQDSQSLVSPRLSFPGILLAPHTGLPAMTAFDASQQAVVMLHRANDLADLPRMETLPAYWEIENMSQPISVDGNTLVAAAMDSNFWIARFGEDEASWVRGPSKDTSNALALVEENGIDCTLYFAADGAVNEDLRFSRSQDFGVHTLLKADAGIVLSMAGCYDETNGDTHLLYENAAGIHWMQLDFTGAILDEDLVVPAGGLVDCAINPQSGRPAVMFYAGGDYQSSELNELGLWTLPVAVNGGVANFDGGSFAAADKLYAFFAADAGQASIYGYEAGVWSHRSDVAYAADSGFVSALEPSTNSPAGLLLFDTTMAGEGYFSYVQEDDSSAPMFVMPPAIGQGVQLHGAARNSELHLAWRNELQNNSSLSYSIDDAETWTYFGSAPVTGLSVGSNELGQFYYSGQSVGSALFYYWDGASPQVQFGVPQGDADSIPFIEKNAFSNDILWYAHDTGTFTSHLLDGFFDTGVPGTDYDYDTVLPGIEPIWEGAADGGGLGNNYLTRAGGSDPEDGGLFHYQGTNSEYSLLALPGALQLEELAAHSLVRGRGQAAISYVGPYSLLPVTALVSSYSDTDQPVMYDLDLLGPDPKRYYTMDYDPLARDARRTVSADRGHGATGIVLISDVEGREQILEWSNYGNWEPLPVPPVLKGKSMHEIVVGGDGRWHIFYRDRYTDQIWRISTEDISL